MPLTTVKRGLLNVFDCVTDCVLTVENGLYNKKNVVHTTDGGSATGGKRRDKRPARYSIRLEYSAPGGGGRVNRANSILDEGGFDLKLPPNRFRTRSIAIVAGYSPERVYSNMPPGAFVVESGVYKVGADRDYVKSEPIYWKQVVYGSRAGSDGSGTMPRTLPNTQVLHGPRLVADQNLELHGPSLRASSPLDQGKPLVDWLSPVNNYSDISSVPHPSSADRSFPSTLLTNPLSSISSPGEPSSSLRSRTHISSLHTIPEDSRLSVTADIHHSSGQYSTGRQLPAGQQQHPSSSSSGLSGQFSQFSRLHSGQFTATSQYSNLSEYTTGGEENNITPTRLSSHQIKYRPSLADYNNDTVYPGGEWSVSRDISFPGHQIGLPYYPAPVHHRAISPSTQYPSASHIQPPKIPDIRVGQVDPKEVDIYQRIAKLDPENTNAEGGRENIRPLATSSPPGKRKRSSATEEDKHKPRYPTPPEQARRAQQPSSSSLPQQRRSSRGSAKLLRGGVESRLQTLRELSEAETGSSTTTTKEEGGGGREYDLISVVSEGLDAEVTAITSSSSPESSGTNTLQQEHNNNNSSSSGIASKNTTSSSSQNQTSLSTSGSLHHQPNNSSSLNQSLEDRLLMTGEDNKQRAMLKDYDSDGMPFYENWPPRPYQFSPSRLKANENHPQYLAAAYHQLEHQTPPPPLSSGVPPFTPHQGGRYHARAGRAGSSPDTSTETPPGSSRPNSSQSAPLDRSVDRHYEWDSVTMDDNAVLAPLPPEWTIRRSPAYNPRRDRDIGPMVQNNRDRVFSDSEIYSNVFPRRGGLQIDVEARVRAMKKEFKEYRKTLNRPVSPPPSSGVPPAPPAAAPALDSERLESLI